MTSSAHQAMASHDSQTQADRAFVEFRRTGSADALARVFDATAPSLLLVVAHFTDDVALAEDLVQLTFLQAIESAASFDETRRVLPWLTSILANRARDLIRRERLRAHDELSVEVADRRPGPPVVTAGREACERIAQAVAALPDRYRQILVYHLVHGLRPIEIAHAQGMSPATVRTRLRRGLQLLRRSLPASVVLPACTVLLAGPGLAAVRHSVLAAVRPTASHLTAASLSGHLLLGVVAMNKLVIAASVIICLGIGVAFAASVGGAREPAPVEPGVAAAGSVTTKGIPARSGNGVTAAGEHDELVGATVEPARTEVAASARPKALVTLRGRCVDETGTGIAAVRVGLRGRLGNQWRKAQFLKTHDQLGWQDPEPQLTVADGTFRLEFEPPPPFAFTLTLGADQWVPVSRSWGSLAPGVTIDLGEVRLRQGCRISGRIVEADGTPLPAVGWSFETQRIPAGAHGFEWTSMLGGLSGADGRFAVSYALSPGRWIPRVRGREVESPKELDLAPGRSHAEFDIVVRLEDLSRQIRGVVVDEVGQPVARANLELTPLLRGPPARFQTARDGTFRIECGARAADRPVRLAITRQGFEPRRGEDEIAWGTRDLRLVLERGAPVTVRVTDAATGEPVEHFGLRVSVKPGSTGRPDNFSRRIEHRGRHAGGEVELRLAAATYVLSVVPDHGPLHPSAFVSIVVRPKQPQTITVGLATAARRTIRLVDGDGKRVAGSKVELLQPFAMAPVDHSTFPVRFDGSSTSSPNKAMAWDEGSTDATGEVELQGPARTPLTLRLTGPHRPQLVAGIVLDGMPLVVEVSRGATIFGRLEPAQFSEQMRAVAGQHAWGRPGFRLSRELPDGQRQGSPGDPPERFPLAADGTFEIGGLSAGTWRLELAFENRTLQLQAIEQLRDGERRELELDLGHLLMARVRGTVLVNGEPMVQGRANLIGTLSHLGATQQVSADGRVAAGGDQPGRFELLTLPGRYALTVTLVDEGVAASLIADESIDLAPGQVAEPTFHVRCARVRCRVVGPDGQPRAGVSLQFQRVGRERGSYLPATDLHGATAGLVPAGRVEMWVAARRAPGAKGAIVRVALSTSEFAVGTREGVMDVVLPAPAGY